MGCTVYLSDKEIQALSSAIGEYNSIANAEDYIDNAEIQNECEILHNFYDKILKSNNKLSKAEYNKALKWATNKQQ